LLVQFAAAQGTMKTGHSAKTDSIHELAQFWDQHDLADFEDELEEVAESVFESANRERDQASSKEEQNSKA
jgi:hypothetical protein